MPTSDDETVPVRVKDLENWMLRFSIDRSSYADRVSAYLPKPRLVTVDLNELNAAVSQWAHKGDQSLMHDLVSNLEKEA